MSPVVNPRRIQWMQTGSLQDFSGGPNIRDAPLELAANEAQDAFNVVMDERGGVQSRLGYTRFNATAFGGGTIVNAFWSKILSNLITQAGPSLYLGTTNTITHTFSTSAIVTFAELNSLIIACHPVDGIWTSPDGSNWTHQTGANIPTAPLCCEIWQNKLWIGQADGSVHWSAIGDPTTWAATDFNKIWEKDQAPIVALHIGSGQDILGDAGLLVFKRESTYRINDSTKGAYTTVDATIGAADPLAVTGVGPKVVTISRYGIFWWATGEVGMTDGTAQRFLPLWESDQLNFATLNQWCAGRKPNGHLVFSVARAGSSVNNLSFEYHDAQQWLCPGSNAMTCYATASDGSDAIYGGSPTVSGRVYQLFQGGTDDGAAIAWRFQTKWVNVAGGFLTHIWSARAHLRGMGECTPLLDYATGGDGKAFDTTTAGVTYDSGINYDSGQVYDGFVLQARQMFYSIGRCRQVSFLFAGSSSTVVMTPPLVSGAVGRTQGAFALYGIEFSFWWMGFQA